MRITKENVIQTASEIADKEGLNKLSLKVIAERLKIRTPSLYNHIASLDALLLEVAHKGMREMNEQMMQSAVGKAGDSAITSLGAAYLNYCILHPGVYEVIQWANWHGNTETISIFESYKKLISTLIISCNFKIQDTTEIQMLLMSIFHGYSTLELGKALVNPEEAMEGLHRAISLVLLGLHTKYD